MLPPVDEAEPAAVALLVGPPLLVLLLLQAARTPEPAASPAAAASPWIAERRENAPDLAGVEGVSVTATPRENVQEDRTTQRTEQNVTRM